MSSKHSKTASKGGDLPAASSAGGSEGDAAGSSPPPAAGAGHRSTPSQGSGGGAASPSNAAGGSGGRSARRSAAAGGGAADLVVLEALGLARGASMVSRIVVELQERAFAQIKMHHAQQVAMADTARHAVELVMQAVEWQMLGHDEGEKMQQRAAAIAEADPDAAEPGPDPLTEPDDRRRPVLDAVAALLALPSPDYNQLWTCEEEPAPADLDRWARGQIPTKTSAPAQTTATAMSDAANATTAFTVHEADEHVHSPVSSATPSRAAGGVAATGLRSPSQAGGGGARKTAAEQAAELLALRATSQPYKLDVSVSREDVQREKQREVELKRLERKKRLAAEVAAVHAADEAERARLERLQNELRGKNYTLDHKGNAILITPSAPSSFPALQPAPVVRVREVYLTDEQEAEIAKKAKRNRHKAMAAPAATATTPAASEEKTQSSLPEPSRRSSDRGLSPSRKAGGKSGKKKSAQDLGFDPLSAKSDLLSTLTVAKGVTLKSGALSKTFDPRCLVFDPRTAAADTQHTAVDHATAELQGLTRAEYLKRLEERRLAASSTLPGGTTATAAVITAVSSSSSKSLASSSSSSSKTLGSVAAAAGSASSSATSSSRPSSSPRAAISAAQAAAAAIAAQEAAPSDDEDAVAADDSFGGTRAISFAPTHSTSSPSAPHSSSSLPAVGSRTLGGAAPPARRPPTSNELFNASITSDPLWGLNPPSQSALPVPTPPRPSKPSQAEREAAVGRIARNPRDRAPLAAAAVLSSMAPERKHLAPAPLGKTTGHGLLDAALVAPLSPSKSGGHHAVTSSSASSAGASPRPFAKVSKPAVVTATDKAKLYFQ